MDSSQIVFPQEVEFGEESSFDKDGVLMNFRYMEEKSKTLVPQPMHEIAVAPRQSAMTAEGDTRQLELLIKMLWVVLQ